MILIVGATGRLGGHVTRQLLATGHQVRAMTRDPAKASALRVDDVEVVQGDLRDPDSLRAAVRGAHVVVSATHSLLGTGMNSSAEVDDRGQRALIDAAKDAEVGHFIFTSAFGASATHPVDFWRTKERMERYLIASGLLYTIIRPSAFMEVHAYDLIGKAVLDGKPVLLFGPGSNPRNFVAADNVATLVVHAISDAKWRGETIEIGGPENLTSNEVVAVFEEISDRKARVVHLPLPVIRVASRLVQPLHQGVSRILQATIVGETTDQRFDLGLLPDSLPLRLTPLKEWARSHVARPGPVSTTTTRSLPG